MKRYAIITIILILLGAGAASAQDKTAAILEYFDSPAEIKVLDADGFEVAELNYGYELAIGSTVRTANSSAEIKLLPSGTIIKLAKATEFKVEALQGLKSAPANSFALTTGKLRTVAAKFGGSKYEIRTPSAVCGVRGTDFGIESVLGVRDVVFVQQGAVEMTKTGGQAVTVGAGQFADAFAATFQAASASAAQMNLFFSDLNFAKLNPTSVNQGPPEAKPGEGGADKSQPAPAEAQAAKTEGPIDPLLALLREALGMEIGSVVIDGQTYSKVILQPTIKAGPLKAVFYLPIIYTGDMFDPGKYYRPKGNNEWSFGTDYDWNARPLDAAHDLGRDLVLKIRYIEWGKQRDQFFFKVGNIPSMTIGHGSIMNGYANDVDFPAVRRVGINLGIDADVGGLEAVVGDVAEPEIFGGRMYVRPILPFRAAFGFTAVADIDPAGDLQNTPTNAAARDVGPMIVNVGTDIDFPIMDPKDSEAFSLVLFGDLSGMLPYLPKKYAASQLEQEGWIPGVLLYGPQGDKKFRNYGVQAGIFGNIFIMDYRLEYRQFNGLFTPGYFGAGWDRNRGAEAVKLLNYLAAPNSAAYDKTTLGIFGQAGFNIFNKLYFRAGYQWPFKFDSSGMIVVTEDDYLTLTLELKKNLIPIKPLSEVTAFFGYSRQQFIPTLLDGKARNLELFDSLTVVKGELVYPIAPSIDLAGMVTTTVLRNGDGTVKLDSNNKPKWAPSITIETRIHF